VLRSRRPAIRLGMPSPTLCPFLRADMGGFPAGSRSFPTLQNRAIYWIAAGQGALEFHQCKSSRPMLASAPNRRNLKRAC
jgi:hypothetical protein